MAKGKRNNNKRGRGGAHNTTNDSITNLSTTAHDGSGDVLDHKGFSTGAFGTSDIDGSGIQSEVIIEGNEMEDAAAAQFGDEVIVPIRSRTSSISPESNDGFLNPNDYSMPAGQHSQSSIRSRTSISNFEKAHRMSQLSIQTNQDEFVLVPGSGGHDGHASIRSMRSHVSRQSGKVSSRDDMLTEGDEIEMGEGEGRGRLESRASQYSHKSGGWNGAGAEEGVECGGYVHVPSYHGSKVSVYSHRSDVDAYSGMGEEVKMRSRAPSHHASKMSMGSHRSHLPHETDPVGDYVYVPPSGGSRPVSHYGSNISVASHLSHLPVENEFDAAAAATVGDYVHVPSRGGSRVPSHYGSKISVDTQHLVQPEYDAAEAAAVGEYVHVPSRGGSRFPSHYGSKISLDTQHLMQPDHDSAAAATVGDYVHVPSRGGSRVPSHYGSKISVAPSHHASRTSVYSHAGGDAGVAPFNSRPASIHASRASIASHHTGGYGTHAPSHHASRASIRSHLDEDRHWMENEERVEEEGEGEEVQVYGGGEVDSRTSRTSTRSQMSCMACADDGESEEEEEDEKAGLPRLGDEIVVPPSAMDEWGDRNEEEERMMEEREDEERRGREVSEWGIPVREQYMEAAASMTHLTVPATSMGGQSHHASTRSMRSDAPIPAVRLSRASLNPSAIDVNHNSMGSLNGGEMEIREEEERRMRRDASRASLRSTASEIAPPMDPSMHTAYSKTSLNSRQAGAQRERRFSSRSTQDAAAWGETVHDEGEEEVFEDHHYGEMEYEGGMRGSHRSLYSTHSSKAGEQTEENLLQAMLNRSREPSIGSMGREADRPFIPPKDGWKSSAYSVKSGTMENERGRSRGHSRSSSIHLVGGEEKRGPLIKPRSRSASVASRRSFEGVNFADQPELYAHPDERFGEKSIGGIPFRRTNEHEKTPQPGSKRGSRVYKQWESEEELQALVSSTSHTSVAENTPPPSAGFTTPKSRNSRESYHGTAEMSMPSPSPFNQTQFQRDEYEARKEAEARAGSAASTFLPFSPSSIRGSPNQTTILPPLVDHEKTETATQTGDTIARAAGQRFALHYGATLSAEPKQHPTGGRHLQHVQLGPSSAASSMHSMAPPPPSCSPPHEEECVLQMHQPLQPMQHSQQQQQMMGEEDRRRMQQMQQQQQARMYDHGDGPSEGARGDLARKSSSLSSRFAPLPAYDMSYVEQYEARSMVSSSKTTTSSMSATSSTLTSQQLQQQSSAASAASSYIDHLRPAQSCERDTNVAASAAAGRGEVTTCAVHSMEMMRDERGYYGQESAETLFSPSKGTVAQKAAAFRMKEEAERAAAAQEHQLPHVQHVQPMQQQHKTHVQQAPQYQQSHHQPKVQHLQQTHQSPHDYQPVYVPHYQPLQHNLQQMQQHSAKKALHLEKLQQEQQGLQQVQQQQSAVRQVPIRMLGEEIVVPEQREEERPKVVNVEIKRAASAAGVRPMQQSGYVQIERPKMNNSFERNNHPAAAVLNNLLSARASSSLNSTRSEEVYTPSVTRHPSSVGGGYLPAYSMNAPSAPAPPPGFGGMKSANSSPGGGYQRVIRPLQSDAATFHYEMKHELGGEGRGGMGEISKDEESLLSRVGAKRAEMSPRGEEEKGRIPLRSREAQKAYANYHERKSSVGSLNGGAASAAAPAVSLTAAPKPFTPPSPYRSVGLGQQQQVYGAFRAQPVQPQQPAAGAAAPMKQPHLERFRGAAVTPTERMGGEKVVAPSEPTKYTGSTIRRAIPQRGHIRNLAAAFDTIQTKADREVTVVEPSVLQRRASSTAGAASAASAAATTLGGAASSGRGAGSVSSVTSSARGFGGQQSGVESDGMHHHHHQQQQQQHYRVPVQLQQSTATAATTTTGSGRTIRAEEEERREREERQMEQQRDMMRRYGDGYITEWQSAVVSHTQQREEMRWEREEEFLIDSESDRPPSRGGVDRPRLTSANVLRTSTPLAGVRNDPRALARALERIPSIRGDETIGRGRGREIGRIRMGGVRALASRFEQAAEEEKEKARSTSMTPRMRRRQEPRRVEGEDMEDRREAAARRLSRGMGGGMERLEREREKRRSQSAHVGMRKRRSSSTSDSGEESVMREMEKVERMAREEILKKEREEMRERRGMRGGEKKEEKEREKRRQSEEERKIDEMFHGLESHESAGERETIASSRGTMSAGGESLRERGQQLKSEMQQLQQQSHQYNQQFVQHSELQLQQQLHHYQYQQQQQQYREHHQHQHHHYQAHLQSVGQQPNAEHFHPIPASQQHQQPAAAAPAATGSGRSAGDRSHLSHLHPIGPNGQLEGGVMGEREVRRRESNGSVMTGATNTQSTTGMASGLVYSPSVYRETGRALRGEGGGQSATLNGVGRVELPVDGGRAATMGAAPATASSPHFSPVNIRGPETAGQRVATYESRDGKNPVRVPSRQVRPYALATSTPMATIHHSSGRGAALMVNDNGVAASGEAVEDDSFLSTISGESRGSGMGGVARSPANQAEYKRQIARLQTVQSMEEEKISITLKALSHARKKQNPNNELAAQRTILLARLRVAALKRELQRLSALAIVRNPPPPVSKHVLGAMDISDITLHLNRNLCSRAPDGGSSSFGFLVVLKCGVEVESTAPVCLVVGQRPAGIKVVHFPEHLRFSNLPVDFTIRLEVYVMKLREPKEESCTSVLALKARNLLVPGTRRAAITAGPGGSTGSGGSPATGNGELPVGELVRCGVTALDRDSVGSIRLYLDAPEYPLEGTIELMSRCSRLPSSVEVDLRGFLTMYKVVGGFGSWVRYWAVLRRGVINFWKYPDDEQLDRGGPVASADLSKCTDGEIVPASREICTRQFAFSIDMLVATTPSIVEKKRVLLAADNRDQLKAWLAALNETLAAIRA